MNYYCKNKDNISKLPSIKSDTHHILPSVKWLNSAFDALSNRKTALCNTYTSELLPVYCSNQYFPLYSAPIHNQHIIQKQMPALLTPVQTTFLSMYISEIACTPLITKKRAVRWTLLSESNFFPLQAQFIIPLYHILCYFFLSIPILFIMKRYGRTCLWTHKNHSRSKSASPSMKMSFIKSGH